VAESPDVVTTEAELSRVVREASSASIIALDVEGNGLFAYRARLCAAQLAWEAEGTTRIAIVDTLAVDPKPLATLLGEGGPTKVLHDFTFDLKLLADAGIELARVVDTSVLARLLGRKATGLASLLASELGIVVTKDLQQHDWSKRPLEAAELEYLASDVRHLIALYQKLTADARALDIEEEVDVECQFKHEAALAPPREKRPSYLRIKGAEALGPESLAVLRRLVEEREEIAAQWDQPPFKVAGNELLLSMAQTKPKSVAEVARLRRGVSPRLLDVAPRLVSAVLAGLSDGKVPAADLERGPRFDREAMAVRRAKEKRLSAWRRTEAQARGVDEQVVLPGHCSADLVALETVDAETIARVKGLGAKRLARYGATLLSLLTQAPDVRPPPEPGGQP
jgi:ribonuclease D